MIVQGAPRTKKHHEAGFTLIELLIVLILVGMIALGLLGGLQFSYKTWETGSDRSATFNQVITLQELLRKQTKAFPSERNLSQEALSLDGDRDELTLISSYPAILSQGGLNEFHFYLKEEKLLMEWQGLTAKGDTSGGLSESTSETRLMLENVSRLTVSYYGFPLTGGQRKWISRWEKRSDLPELIKLSVEFNEDHSQLRWPELILQPLVQGANKIY